MRPLLVTLPTRTSPRPSDQPYRFSVRVWLDSSPWQFPRARITGISLSTEAPMLLPYVAPTTDWIRLQRRRPVTIVLDEAPPECKLYMGADARTVIFPR
jgi:membrane fusion protein, multidrug efflux system